MDQNSNSVVSPEQFQLNHLARRLSEVVAEYELKMSAAAVQVQVLSQELKIAQDKLEKHEGAEEAAEINVDDLGPEPNAPGPETEGDDK